MGEFTEKLARSSRISRLLAEETARAELRVYWLSFVKDAGFAGVAIVKAFGPTDAVRQSHLKGINPGGQVGIAEIELTMAAEKIPPAAMDRLLTLDECRKYFGELVNGNGEDI